MKKGYFVIALAVLTAFAPAARAADIWELADSEDYGSKASGMFGRGLLNTLTSPVDIFGHIGYGTVYGPPVIGTLAGVGSGLGCTVFRLTSGVTDILTFWVPNFHGMRIGRSYTNCFEDESTTSSLNAQQYRYEPAAGEGYNAPASSAVAPPGPGTQPVTVVGPAPSSPAPAEESPMKYIKTASKPAAQHDPTKYVKKSTSQTAGNQDRMKYVK